MYLIKFYFLILNMFLINVLSTDHKINVSDSEYSNYDSLDNSFLCATTWKSTLKISDAGNVRDSIFFGTSVNGTNGIDTCLGEISLPPVPPGGSFDVRFNITGDYSKTDIRKDSVADKIWTVQFQPSPSGYPVTFTWNNNVFPSAGYFYLKDNVGGNIVSINMRAQNSFTLTDSGISSLSIEYMRVKINLKLIPEGFYFPLFDKLSRRDTFSVYLRNAAAPYAVIDSAKAVIDSNTFSQIFVFSKSTAGSYYIVVKHLNSVETWSKSGGTSISTNGTTFNYDFTSSAIQAYGNNLQLKSGKYCIYGGDVNQDGFVDLFDLIIVFNGSKNFITGRFMPADLNGDSIVDLTDIALCYNNSSNFIRIKRP